MDRMNCIFDRAQYLTGESVTIRFPFPLTEPELKLFRLAERVEARIVYSREKAVISGLGPGNYGVTVAGRGYSWEGAFDVTDSQRRVTRYGFLSDFTARDNDVQDVEWMRDLHLNAVQFYDWMYRHDRLLPPGTDYTDPLGREMCLDSVKKKIDACKAMGIRPFAYGAVYAATEQTFQSHPEWGMYTMDGEPLLFADWLNYMNISPDSGWPAHLLGEYRKAVAFGFAGIHMDTYGFPKFTWDAEGKPVELEQEFPGLINEAAKQVRECDREAGVIFNAVNNWPMEAVARADQDAVYIEVWPPNDSYYDLYTLIRSARQCSGKCVVLAAYMKPFLNSPVEKAERALRLTWAAISAAGGTQLVFGENRAALQDSYYANYARLDRKFAAVVQKYCDFLVRYGDLMYDDPGTDVSKTSACGINEDICLASAQCSFSADAADDTVWTVIRSSRRRISLHLINLCGNDNQWNREKEEPRTIENIRLRLRLDRPLKGIYWASPDNESLAAMALLCSCVRTAQGRVYELTIPQVEYWTAVWIEVGD